MEHWEPINCTNGYYEISSLGRVKSTKRTLTQSNGRIRTFPEKIKSFNSNGSGYLAVNMFKDSKCIRRYIHRLVAEAFIPNPNNLPQVNHKDGDKENNCIENLEWCSAKDNCQHAIDNNLYQMARGEASGSSKLKESDIYKIREMAKSGSMHKDIAPIFSVQRQTISKILSGKLWSHV